MFDTICSEVIKKYNFSLREIAKYIRLTKMAAYKPTHQRINYDFSSPNKLAHIFCLTFVIPLMIGLNIHNRDLYEEFISGKNPQPLVELLSEKYYFSLNQLLSDGETFTREHSDKTFVKLQDKLTELYNVLFNEDFSKSPYEITIGKLSFENGIQNLLLDTEYMFSKYTDIYTED